MRYQSLRQKMVTDQLERRGIRDQAVLAAMREVPRELFVPGDHREAAYEDSALPLEFRQTISQPYTVAFMCQSLELMPEDNVLEIGAGSGYGAAVLSRLAHHVCTIERIPELAEQARERLEELGISNVDVFVGDGTRGLPERAPFDAICVTAAAEILPPSYARQLSEGGRILIPISGDDDAQTMTRFTRRGDRLKRENLGVFRFVPLIGDYR